MHNNVTLTDGPFVKPCALSTGCTFSNQLIWIKPWSLFSTLNYYNNLRETFSTTLKLFNDGFYAEICKRMNKYKNST